jgi:AraC-like DNA-binding protein
MSSSHANGVLYTDHADLRSAVPVASLWSYETCEPTTERRPIVVNADGNREFWLDRCDPRLNPILPGTAVSAVINFGDDWAAGRSLVASALIPRLSVIGPVTEPRILRVGRSVRAIGVVLPSAMTSRAFGVPAPALLNHIVPLGDLWGRKDADRLGELLSGLPIRRAVSVLRDEVVARISHFTGTDPVALATCRLIARHGGSVSIDHLAKSHGISRQQFARRFHSTAGMPPKLFARITRFQRLVHMLLTTDVSNWAAQSSAAGFYDQAHMINEFRGFAGSSPTLFFQPHGESPRREIHLRGRPSEWLTPKLT